jgi:hypothetical protein
VASAAFLVPAAPAAAASFPLTLATEGEGSGAIKCKVGAGPVEPCAAEYPEGTEVAFVAEPATGSEFVEWGGDCIGQPECELTIEEATLVTAVFELEAVPLEVSTEGEGLGEIECEVEGGPVEECEAEYPYGTEIAFLAEPGPGSEFVEWGEDCGGSGPCELTMTAEKSVSALFELVHFALEIEFEGSGEGTVECEVEGGPAEDCEPTYLEGTEVALVAEPEVGSEFVEWEGDCTGAGPCEVTMDAEHSVTANFALITFTLEVEVEGSGSGTVTSSPAGINCGATCTAEFQEGATIILTAEPDPGSEFVEWIGCEFETGNECEVTMEENTEVTAVFALITFTLEVELEGSGSGTVSAPEDLICPSVCSGVYSAGETVTLTASPSVGSEFGGWTGCEEEPSATECEVTVEEDTTVTARFDLEPPSEFALTVSLAGSGGGTVASSPAGIDCGIDCSEAFTAGTEVTLAATPASGSTFAGWSGSCAGAGSCKVTMSQARSVTATFEKAPAPPPAAGTAVAAHTAKVKGGKAQLKLTCKGEGPCKGSLKLTAKIKSGGKTKSLTIGKASFSLGVGASTTLKIKLSGPAKQALAKGPLKAKVGGSGVAASTVKLKAAGK